MEQKNARGSSRMQYAGKEAQREWSPENDACVRQIAEAGNDFGVSDAVDESRQGKDKADERTGRANVEECASSANGRTDQDESSEGANERGERNEKGICGTDVMLAAGEKMAQFVGEENRQQRSSKRQASQESGWVFVKESESMEEVVPGNGFVVGESGSELRSCGKTGAKCQEKKYDCEHERFERRAWKNRDVKLRARV